MCLRCAITSRQATVAPHRSPANPSAAQIANFLRKVFLLTVHPLYLLRKHEPASRHAKRASHGLSAAQIANFLRKAFLLTVHPQASNTPILRRSELVTP